MLHFFDHLTASIVLGYLMGVGVAGIAYAIFVVPSFFISSYDKLLDRIEERIPVIKVLILIWLASGTYLSYWVYH